MRALVLNNDYSPIGVCTVEKAFLLVFLDKADQVEPFKEKLLRSVNKSFAMPAVVRLKRYVSIPYKGVELTRNNVFKRDAFECQYCGSKKDLTLDHVLPRSRGGASSWKNLTTACKTCNAKKGDYTPEEAEMILKNKPHRPSYIMFIRDYSGFLVEEWRPFLQMAG